MKQERETANCQRTGVHLAQLLGCDSILAAKNLLFYFLQEPGSIWKQQEVKN
jgi:hypothetical protein